jgi:hypothetical protein
MDLVKLLNLFRDICENLAEVESYTEGVEFDLALIQTHQTTFRGVHIQPLGSQMIFSPNASFSEKRFRIWSYSILLGTDDDILSVWNRTEIVIEDILRSLSRTGGIKLNNSPLIIPFESKSGELLAGNFTEVSILVPIISGDCYIPKKLN